MLAVLNPSNSRVRFKNVFFYSALTDITIKPIECSSLHSYYFEVHSPTDIGLFFKVDGSAGTLANSSLYRSSSNPLSREFITEITKGSALPNCVTDAHIFLLNYRRSYSLYSLLNLTANSIGIPESFIPGYDQFRKSELNECMMNIDDSCHGLIYVHVPACKSNRYRKIFFTFTNKGELRASYTPLFNFPTRIVKAVQSNILQDGLVEGYKPTLIIGTDNLKIGDKFSNIRKYMRIPLYSHIPSCYHTYKVTDFNLNHYWDWKTEKIIRTFETLNYPFYRSLNTESYIDARNSFIRT